MLFPKIFHSCQDFIEDGYIQFNKVKENDPIYIYTDISREVILQTGWKIKVFLGKENCVYLTELPF